MNSNTERTAHIVQGCPAPEFATFEIIALFGADRILNKNARAYYYIVGKPGLQTVSIACQEVMVKNSAG